MDAPPAHENASAFARIARHLVGLGLSAPEIQAEDPDNGFLLIEDFGDETFTRLIGDGEAEEPLYRMALDVLIHLHALDAARAVPPDLAPYDEARLLAEAALLPDWFLPRVQGRAPAARARAEYDAAWRAVFAPVHDEPRTLVLRDFHVDNLMRLAGRTGVRRCGILDFQDALAGPPAYDLMSLLEDARRDVPSELAARLLADYVAAMPRLADAAARDRFERASVVLAAQRHAKVIGIFTRLAARDGKPIYLPHVPRVWRMLERALRHPALGPVARWFDRNVPPEQRRSPPWPEKAP
jgi:aminoglycoside/choline kinase family phosphotransferase